MHLLTSKIPPLNNGAHTFSEAFFSMFAQADTVNIASGYISADSLAELHETFSRSTEKQIKLNLVLGMHYFEGITRQQFEAAKKLNGILNNRQLGEVSVVRDFKFHGKLYCFEKEGTPFAAIVGSSNLDNISKTHTSFETDLLADNSDGDVLQQVDDFFHKLYPDSTITLPEWSPQSFLPTHSPLEGYADVEKISSAALEAVQATKTERTFLIPLKPEPKSNLNVFFGKGRTSKNGLVIPRPWYEVELIVSSQITQQEGYPKGEFEVLTNDQWAFRCYTGGDYYKNFRSCKDLQILGRWIKGQLENGGIIEPGDHITEEALRKFGKQSLRLTQTTNPDVWYMELV